MDVSVVFTGCATSADVAEVTCRMNDLDDKAGGLSNRLIDLTSAVELQFGFEAVADHFARRRRDGLCRSARIALVATSPVQYGIGRMFEMMSEQRHTSVAIFRDTPAALRWLVPPPV